MPETAGAVGLRTRSGILREKKYSKLDVWQIKHRLPKGIFNILPPICICICICRRIHHQKSKFDLLVFRITFSWDLVENWAQHINNAAGPNCSLGTWTKTNFHNFSFFLFFRIKPFLSGQQPYSIVEIRWTVKGQLQWFETVVPGYVALAKA